MTRRVSLLIGAALTACLVAPAAAIAAEPSPTSAGVAGPSEPDPRALSASDEAALTLPIVSEDMARLASDLTESFGDDPNFASAEVTEDRSKVVVHWYGAPSEEVKDIVDDVASVVTNFEDVQYRPGDLRATASTLLENFPSIASVSVRPDASGLDVSVRPDLSAAGRRAVIPDLASITGFPVNVDHAAPEPAMTRQYDVNYHLGGARVYRFEDPFIRGGCSSGFSVVRQSDPTEQGSMLAAHCGSVGSQFVTSDGTFATHYGKVAIRDTGYDGAILSMAWSQPFIWTSTWDSSVYTQINGAASPYVGQELCYSGSYTGLVCGNIVQTTGVVMNLGGDLTAVTAFQTQNNAGSPAVGNGDSGGPGYQLVNTVNGVRRWAVGIISAIPNDSPTTCLGTPGGGASDRRCSPTVYATSVVMIGNRTGWYVPSS